VERIFENKVAVRRDAVYEKELIKTGQQECNGDVTIFGADFLEPGTQRKHIVTEENCEAVVLALLALAALCVTLVLTLHLC